MNILVTGAKGMVGTALVNNLKNIRDGKNKTRKELHIDEIYEYDLNSTPAELDEYCQKADFVFNLAGVNRPENPEDFMKGNFGFAFDLLNCLKKHNNKATIMLSSSIQATLAGRFGNSEYGRSKKAGEELFFPCGEIADDPGILSGIVDIEEIGQREIPAAFPVAAAERGFAGRDQRSAVPDEFAQASGLLRRHEDRPVYDDRPKTGELLCLIGDDPVRYMQPIQYLGRSEHLVERRVLADTHIVRIALVEPGKRSAVLLFADAAGHREVEPDLRPQRRPQLRHAFAEGFKPGDDPAQPLVEGPRQGTVRVDRVDEEIGAAVGQRGRGVEKQLLIRLGRGVVVQVHAA